MRIFLSLLPIFLIIIPIKASLARDSVNTEVSDFYGKWMPISGASASIIGPITIEKNILIFNGNKSISLINPIKEHKIYFVLGNYINQFVITYDVLSKTKIRSLNGNQLCDFNADKLHMWIEKQYDPMGLRGPEDVLEFQFTKGPSSFGKLGQQDCGTYNYSKFDLPTK